MENQETDIEIVLEQKLSQKDKEQYKQEFLIIELLENHLKDKKNEQNENQIKKHLSQYEDFLEIAFNILYQKLYPNQDIENLVIYHINTIFNDQNIEDIDLWVAIKKKPQIMTQMLKLLENYKNNDKLILQPITKYYSLCIANYNTYWSEFLDQCEKLQIFDFSVIDQIVQYLSLQHKIQEIFVLEPKLFIIIHQFIQEQLKAKNFEQYQKLQDLIIEFCVIKQNFKDAYGTKRNYYFEAPSTDKEIKEQYQQILEKYKNKQDETEEKEEEIEFLYCKCIDNHYSKLIQETFYMYIDNILRNPEDYDYQDFQIKNFIDQNCLLTVKSSQLQELEKVIQNLENREVYLFLKDIIKINKRAIFLEINLPKDNEKIEMEIEEQKKLEPEKDKLNEQQFDKLANNIKDLIIQYI